MNGHDGKLKQEAKGGIGRDAYNFLVAAPVMLQPPTSDEGGAGCFVGGRHSCEFALETGVSQLRKQLSDQRRTILPKLFVYQPTGHVVLPSWLSAEVVRYLPAVGCILMPFLILLTYQVTVRELQTSIPIERTHIVGPDCPTPDRQKAAEGEKASSLVLQTLSVKGSDVSGRYGFTTSSAILRVLSLVGIGFALFFIFRRTSPIEGVITGIASVGSGLALALLFSLDREEGTRRTLVDPIMKAAEHADLPALLGEEILPGLRENVYVMVNHNIYFGITAVAVMLCALGVVAIRARDRELTPAILRKRLFDIKWAMIFAAAVLVMTVITTRALIDWQLSFLCESYRNGLKPAAAALANYWGTGSSIVLLGALLPSYFSWSRDVARWATITKPDASEKERRSLIESEALDFAPTTSASALLTVIIPVLSGPALELIKGLGELVR